MNHLARMADYVVNSTSEKLTESDRITLSNHFLDTIGALVTGRFTSEGKNLANYGLLLSGQIEGNVSMLDKVFIYSSITRSTDIDDIHLLSGTTPGSVIIPVALAIAPHVPHISHKTFYNGIVVGYEALTRLGRAIRGPEVLYKGIWPTYFCAAFGAAATASHMLGLSEKQAVHALSLALTLSTGGTGRISGDFPSRWLTLGNAARSGCLAALSINMGFSSDADILTNEWFKRTYGLELNTGHLIDDLGKKSVMNELSMKPFCSAKQVIGAIYGMNQLLSEGINPKDIQEVRVSVPPCYAAMIDHDIVFKDRISTFTSASYQLALAAFQPDRLFDVDRTGIEKTVEISTFMEKVKVMPDPSLLSYYPRNWPAKVEILTANHSIQALITDVPGDPGQQLNSDQVQQKFKRFVEHILGEPVVNQLIQLTADALKDDDKLFALSEQMNKLIVQGQVK